MHREPGAPRWYHGWNIVGAIILGQILLQGLTVNCFSLFVTDWSREFHAPISALAVAISLFAVACIVAAPLAGWAADRYPARRVFGVAYLLAIAMYVSFGFVTAAWQILALYASLAAVSNSFAGAAPCQALVARWFVRRRGLAMGITAGGIVLAGVLFPPMVTALIPVLGWRGVWWVFGGCMLVVAPLILMVVRDRPGPADSQAYLGAQAGALSAPTLSYREILSRPNFWLIGISFFLIFCSYIAVMFNLAPLVMSHGFSKPTAGLELSALSLAALVGKIGLGAFSDRFGNRKSFIMLALFAIVGCGLVLIAPMGLVGLTAGLVLVGASSAAWTPMAAAVAVEFGAANFGRVFGILTACSPLGSLTAPVFARMKEASGSYDLGLTCLIIGGVAGGVAAAFLKEKTAGEARPGLAAPLPSAVASGSG